MYYQQNLTGIHTPIVVYSCVRVHICVCMHVHTCAHSCICVRMHRRGSGGLLGGMPPFADKKDKGALC